MSDFLQFLNQVQPGSYVESGVIVADLGEKRFTVSINGQHRDIASAMDLTSGLLPGARVIINRTSTGNRYIIGVTNQFTAYNSQEVIIDG